MSQGAKAADDLDVIRENEYEYPGVVGSTAAHLSKFMNNGLPDTFYFAFYFLSRLGGRPSQLELPPPNSLGCGKISFVQVLHPPLSSVCVGEGGQGQGPGPVDLKQLELQPRQPLRSLLRLLTYLTPADPCATVAPCTEHPRPLH